MLLPQWSSSYPGKPDHWFPLLRPPKGYCKSGGPLTCPHELREKVSILNAYYLPGADPQAVYPSISPVNSFRVVFSLYFGTNLSPLTDRTFAHENDRHPYTWFEVTSTVAPE